MSIQQNFKNNMHLVPSKDFKIDKALMLHMSPKPLPHKRPIAAPLSSLFFRVLTMTKAEVVVPIAGHHNASQLTPVHGSNFLYNVHPTESSAVHEEIIHTWMCNK